MHDLEEFVFIRAMAKAREMKSGEATTRSEHRNFEVL